MANDEKKRWSARDPWGGDWHALADALHRRPHETARTLRVALGLTTHTMAEFLEVPAGSYRRWESTGRVQTLLILLAWQKALDTWEPFDRWKGSHVLFESWLEKDPSATLALLMDDMNISQKRVGEWLGIATPTVSHWVTGRRPMPAVHHEMITQLWQKMIA